MRKNLAFVFIILFFSSFNQPIPFAEDMTNIKVMSFNIRYANEADGKHAWKYRKERVANLISFYEVDLLGMQEALYEQVQYLDEQLSDFAWYGLGRDDGKQAGEFSPIFYRKSAFELLDKGTFWLSETPEKPSLGWDADIKRVVSWVKLRDKENDQDFYYFNTHFDHRGEKAREESAKLILERINKIAKGFPVIVTGDFNASPDSKPYQVLTSTSSGLKDALEISKLPHYGAMKSFSGFEVTPELPGDRIDYVFVNDKVEVLKHGILTDAREGAYASDHLPVLAEVRLK